MIDAEILAKIKDHPFITLRKSFQEIEHVDEFWDKICGKKIVTDLMYKPTELKGGEGKQKSHLINNITFENVSFSKTIISELTFQSCYFVNCLFIGTTFKKLKIRNCTFHNCNMLGCHFEDTFVSVPSFDKCLDKKKYANIGIHLYQQLMRNFKIIDQPDHFREADFLFMKWKRYQRWHKVLLQDDAKSEKSLNFRETVAMLLAIAWDYTYQKAL